MWAAGCSDLRRDSTVAELPRPTRPREPTLAEIFLNTNYLYPARDYLTFSGLGRALVGDEAWNVGAAGRIGPSSIFTDRIIAALDAADFDRTLGWLSPPRGPWTIVTAKTVGATRGFIGRDASGRTFSVKFDDPEFPELGSAAEAIASRIYAALGYPVPAVYVVTVSGTGDPRCDGHRAAASEFVPGRPFGTFSMDRFRMRREARALRLVAAWLNDTDRSDNNTLVTLDGGRVRCWLLDFNSALGSWNGRPKEPWRGRRCAWDVEWQLVTLFTLGVVHPDIDANEPVVSPAVGRFSASFRPWLWRPQNPLTAFDRLTRSDAEWMLKRIDSLPEAQLRAIVAAAHYSHASDAEYVLQTLLQRRERLREFVK